MNRYLITFTGRAYDIGGSIVEANNPSSALAAFVQDEPDAVPVGIIRLDNLRPITGSWNQVRPITTTDPRYRIANS